MHLAGQTFLITGGASGLGAACARRFAAAGAQVVLADLNAALGSELAQSLGPNARFVRTDVTDEASVRAVVQTAVDAFAGLQGLVNCAGIGLASRTLGRDGPHALDAFVRVITINLVGTFNAIRLAAAAMAGGQPNSAGERGVIINTASVAASSSTPHSWADCPSRRATRLASRCPFRHASAGPKSMLPSRSTLSKMKCSTAK